MFGSILKELNSLLGPAWLRSRMFAFHIISLGFKPGTEMFKAVPKVQAVPVGLGRFKIF